MAIVLDGTTGITTPDLTDTSLTSGRVVYAGTSGNLTGSTALTFDGAILGVNGISVGRGAGAVATNTAVGASALAANTTGLGNTSVGYQALDVSTSSDYHTAVGWNALGANTTGARNTAFGAASLATNSTGGYNVAMGVNAGYAITTGSNNVALGYDSLSSNTTASNNTAVGYQAGYTNTTGAYNTFFGFQSGYTSNYNGTANNNCFGTQSGFSLTTGIQNTFSGPGSGYYVTTGSKNTIIGGYNGNTGGLDIRTANNYIVLSDGDGNPRQIQDGSGNIFWKGSGAGAQTLAGITGGTGDAKGIDNSDGARLLSSRGSTAAREHYIFYNPNGDVGSIDTSGTSTSYTTSSDYRLKNTIAPMTGALAKVALLKPCTYKWNVDGSNGQGFIAHELQDVVPECVLGEKDALDADGKPQYQGIDTSFLVATLTAAIQELKAEFDAYKSSHP